MILAALVVLAFAGVAFVDWIYLRRHHRRAFLFELVVLVALLVIVLRPDWLTAVAARAGIGRGVDLVIYPALVWLFREAVLGRVRYYSHEAQITSLVRHLAKIEATAVPVPHPGDVPSHSELRV
jgi:hypothetical protein